MKRILIAVALAFAAVVYADTGAKTKAQAQADAGYTPPASAEKPTVKTGGTVQSDYTPPEAQFQKKAPAKKATKPQGSISLTHEYVLAYYAPGKDWHRDAPVWTERFHNLVPDVSINKMLSDTYTTKAADSQVYVGLITSNGNCAGGTLNCGCAAGDTMASHAGWTEAVPYSNSTRVVWCPGGGSIGSNACTGMGAVTGKSTTNSTAPAVFNINGTATIGGAFLVSGSPGTADTKSGTGGTPRSCGAFTTGDKAVSSGGTLTVTITASGS